MLDCRPILMTMADWNTFNTMVHDVIEEYPTSGLDKANINIKEPRAWVAAHDCKNDPLAALGNPEAYIHMYVGFLSLWTRSAANIDILHRLSMLHPGIVHTYNNRDNKTEPMIVISSGSLLFWHQLIVQETKNGASSMQLKFLNACCDYIIRAGFKEFLRGHTTYNLATGPYIIT